MKKYIVLFIVLVVFGLSSFQVSKKANKPTNIILLIGDGMGLSQMSAAYFYGTNEPNFSRFTHVGLSKTPSSKQKITDSAAGALAFSAGKKSYNGAIGVDENKKPVETIVEYFEKKNNKTAIIATSSITHATPASFYAHVNSRNEPFKIAAFLPASGVDFFAGGGMQYFRDSRRSHGLFDELLLSDYKMDTSNLKPLGSLEYNKKYGFLLAEDGMPKMSENRGSFLKDATQLALSYFSQGSTPFFMMVEGSQIDWGGHANNADYVVREVLDFDESVGAALDFAEKDGNTLVIVTADHETGGFTLASKEKKVPFKGLQRDYNEIEPQFSTGGHSATMVPVLAYGPGAELFSGIYENTEVHTKMMALIQ